MTKVSKIAPTLLVAILATSVLPPTKAWGETFDCLVEPKLVTQIGTPVQGVIDQLIVDRSDIVRRGEPIAKLHSDVELATYRQAKVRAETTAEVHARQADLSLAQTNMDRVSNLHGQEMVPDQQLDEAQAQLDVAKAALEQANENTKLLKHELRRSKELLAQRTIRSPVDGVVVQHQAFPGEFVYENPIMTIAQLDPLRIEVVLPARLFGQFKPGDFATVTPEIASLGPIQAEVEVVDRLLDTRSGTFGVRLKLPNPDMNIPGGQKCRLEFDDNVATSTQEELAVR